jgi:nucleotide-binding universal stress UspA family protein
MAEGVIVPLDGSPLGETVLPYAKRLAAALGLEVTLLRVVEPTAKELRRYAAGEKRPQIPEGGKEARAYLDKAGRYFQGSGVTVSTQVVTGVPAVEIIAAGEKDPASYIIMPTHGRSGVRRWLIGSVADKVIQFAVNPLFIMHPAAKSPLAPEAGLSAVIVALDGSSVAEEVLPQVKRLAKALGLRVTLLQATPSLADAAKWNTAYMGAPVVDYATIVEDMAKDAAKYLESIAARLRTAGIKDVRESVVQGDAASAIITAGEGSHGSFVAMTTRGRTGLKRTLLGSVADRVVRHGGTPVLLVRPK